MKMQIPEIQYEFCRTAIRNLEKELTRARKLSILTIFCDTEPLQQK
jgi:peroxiredoxin